MIKIKFSTTRVIFITIFMLLCITIFLFYKFRDTSDIGHFNDLDLASRPFTFAAAVKKSAPAVVSIQTSNVANSQRGLGSGVIIDIEGHILTNEHVIANAQSIIVKLVDGRSASANIIGTDPETDLALLKIDLTDLPVINMGNSSKLQVGDLVLAIGNPYGLKNAVTQGIVSARASIQEIYNAAQEFGLLLDDLIQTDAAINLGNSGGALVDIHGNLVGINTALLSNLSGSQGIGFAIPIDTAKEILPELVAKGSIKRAWLGAQLSDLPVDTRQHLHFSEQDGIYIQDTLRNSPAQKAGILPGDILTKINQQPVTDVMSAVRLISHLKLDQTYAVEIFRSGEKMVYNVKFVTRPEI